VRIDPRGAPRPHLVYCFVTARGYFGEGLRLWFGSVTHRLAQDADARSSQAILVEKFGVSIRNVTHTSSRQRIFRIVADDDIEKVGEIGHCARHRTERARDLRPPVIHTAAADQPSGWPHPHNGIP